MMKNTSSKSFERWSFTATTSYWGKL